MLDPESMLWLALSDESPEFARATMRLHGFGEIARVDLGTARELAILAKVYNRSRTVIRPLFASLVEIDPQLALEWLDDRELVAQKDHELTASEFFSRWAEIDPSPVPIHRGAGALGAA